MKSKISLFVVFVLIAGCSSSKPMLNERLLKQAEEGYLLILKSTNHGSIESAIYNIVTMHTYFPLKNIDKFKRELSRLSETGPTPKIRYKARIAHKLLKRNEGGMTAEIYSEYMEPERLFGIIEHVLDKKPVYAIEE